ncbi:MAG TPA: hypothetical protein VMF30_11900 [Pirellulales bacterium]|nr:hypothetical protein [Pirellulales bacterium]
MKLPKPGNRSCQTNESGREETGWGPRGERLVAEYLRSWGLRDPQTIAAVSKYWVESVSVAPRSGVSSLADFYRMVMRRVISDLGQWLDHLGRQVGIAECEIPARRGLVALELQSLVDRFPAALLDDRPLPSWLMEQLAAAAVPVVPSGSPTHMPTQSLAPALSPEHFPRWQEGWDALCRQVRGAMAGAGAAELFTHDRAAGDPGSRGVASSDG